MLVSIELGHVDRDKLHVRGLKERLRGRGEVAQPGADGDDQIRLSGQAIRGQRACHPDRAHVLRVIPGQRALARLRLARRDARLLHEAL